MKTKRKIAALLAIVMAFSLSTGALAAEWSDFTDISGHWAEPTLQKGFSDELITGYEDSTLRPDAPITGAQMISVLCRVLGATQAADILALNLPADAWYADAAGKALYLGLISPKAGSLDAPMTRQNAFGMLAKAFCLTPAAPDTSILNAYSDAKLLTPENKPAMAALISAKLVTGYAGSLNANGSITRAEFITILYRIAENYILPSALTPETASCVLKGDGALKDITLPCGVWFDCSAESISLENVSMPSLTLRSHKLANLSLIGSTSISSLAIAVGSGDVSLKDSSAKIGTLRLASCSDATVGANVESIEITGSGIPVTISGSHNSLIISGNNNIITLAPDAVFSHIKILGSGNKITTNTPAVTPTPAPTEAVKSESLPLEILPSEAEPAEAAPAEPLSSEDPALNTAPIEAALSETVTAEATPPVTEATPPVTEATPPVTEATPPVTEATPPVTEATPPVTEATPPVTEATPPVTEATPPVTEATLAEATSAPIAPPPAVLEIIISGANNHLSLSAPSSATLSISGNTNVVLANFAGVVSSALIPGTGNWINLRGIGGASAVDIGGNSNTFGIENACALSSVKAAGTGNAFSALSAKSSVQKLEAIGKSNHFTINGVLTNAMVSGRGTILDGKGRAENLTLEATGCKITLPVAHMTDNSVNLDEERILKLVTTGYRGNRTLKWAQEHDYEDYEKEIWVKAKGYKSQTPNLIWISIATQHVNIFKNNAGNWELVRSCIVGTGAPGHNTPLGVFTTTYKQKAGWTTGTYTCRPVVGFKSGSGYAFHSRLYYPNSAKLSDPNIGFPISHGCIRMYDEDVNYIFDNIPGGTTVVVY